MIEYLVQCVNVSKQSVEENRKAKKEKETKKHSNVLDCVVCTMSPYNEEAREQRIKKIHLTRRQAPVKHNKKG